MKVLILSDTHGEDRNVIAALVKEMPVDVILHLGDAQEDEDEFAEVVLGEDIPVYLVKGNCDYYSDSPLSRVMELAGHRILMTHGHMQSVHRGTGELAELALANQCSIALYGHTHMPEIDDTDPKVLIMNPGSLSLPRQKGRQASYIVLDLARGRKPKAEIRFI